MTGLTNGTFDVSVNNQRRTGNGDFGVFGDITLAGGTGNLVFTNSNSFDGGASLFNSIGIVTGTGVTSVSLTLNSDQFIAGRDIGTGSTGLPMFLLLVL